METKPLSAVIDDELRIANRAIGELAWELAKARGDEDPHASALAYIDEARAKAEETKGEA